MTSTRIKIAKTLVAMVVSTASIGSAAALATAQDSHQLRAQVATSEAVYSGTDTTGWD
ncbi:hypothetical protein AB0B12_05030 [Streptomyces sp. NPDC044780]|uniref:Uncharacterized protein n=1 Tax=Streptomyces luomodiensis TaxID=3026192 RepID=A0ABY9V0E6_9ACTN|nr:hypothetical protein [Streptomyces sp. SCA4-21]WNE98327.1 hypothetical protein PS467_24845 [Streptomyces sp. SCA4-21]